MRVEHTKAGLIHFDLEPREADELHTHDHFQLSLPLSKPIDVLFNGRLLTVDPGEALIAAPDDRHQHEAKNDRADILLVSVHAEQLADAFAEKIGEAPRGTIEFAPIQKDSHALLARFARESFYWAAQNGLSTGGAAWDAFEQKLAHTFLDACAGTHSDAWDAGQPENPLVERARHLIEVHHREAIDLEQLAAALYVSKYHLHRLFKSATGQTPADYLHTVRVNAAIRDMRAGRRDITAIAYDAGYQSPSTFRRAFKKQTGQTPADYIKTK